MSQKGTIETEYSPAETVLDSEDEVTADLTCNDCSCNLM